MPSYQPYSIQQNGSNTTNTSTKNVGGAVINAGTKTSLVDNVVLGTSEVGAFGSKVVQNTVTESDYAAVASSGSPNFAYNNQKPIAMRYSTTVAGTGNLFLQSGATVPGLTRSIHRLETVRTRRLTTAIRAGSWNIYTGLFGSAPTVAVDNWYSVAANGTSATSTDQAADPTLSVPGKLTYKLGKKVPVSANYNAKTA